MIKLKTTKLWQILWKIKHESKKIVLKLASKIFIFFPIRTNKVVFDNFCGKGCGDNPGAIAQKLLEEMPSVDIVWIGCDENIRLIDNTRYVKIDSLRSMYEYATAKVWVDNVRNMLKPKKRNGQFYLQTWHGTYGPKLSEGDAISCLNPQYIKAAMNDGRETDAIIVHSSLQEEVYRRAFWLNDSVEYLRIGYPRNDVIYNHTVNKGHIRESLKLKKDDFVVLYVPTFRDDYGTEGYIKDFSNVINAFQITFGKTCKLIVRLHPNASFQQSSYVYNDSLINGSNYPDMQSLADISDAMITDYSSASVEFGVSCKPVFLFLSDFEEYKSVGRVNDEIFTFPFPISFTEDELVDSIKNIDLDDYSCKVKVFYEKNVIYDRGEASFQAAKWIINKLR